MRTLSNEHKNNLKALINNSPEFTTKESKLGDFFNCYLICEVIARRLVRYYYQKDKKVLSLSNIKTAFKTYFPSEIDKIEIDKIFKGNKGKKNQKSCRQLRNGYLHSLSSSDKLEIETRYEVLEEYMKKWINLFKELS